MFWELFIKRVTKLQSASKDFVNKTDSSVMKRLFIVSRFSFRAFYKCTFCG